MLKIQLQRFDRYRIRPVDAFPARNRPRRRRKQRFVEGHGCQCDDIGLDDLARVLNEFEFARVPVGSEIEVVGELFTSLDIR